MGRPGAVPWGGSHDAIGLAPTVGAFLGFPTPQARGRTLPIVAAL